MAICIENISKEFNIGEKQSYLTFRDQLAQLGNFPKRLFNKKKSTHNETPFWALKDVSFDIKEGEVVGLIGRNGAGKSTLLKILARIIDPTHGQIKLKGRVGSLLEVGTGFHPELTGRENIFLNGSILGMSKREIYTKFDDIVQYAEIEKFIDTPVKRYSSGMYMRLAFSIAAQLEPEIMLIDEVLAVGDATFQKKCLNSMREIGESGRTIIFVSHNINAVNRLCSRAVYLDQGRLIDDGPTSEVTGRYLTAGTGFSSWRTWPEEMLPGNDIVRLKSIRIMNAQQEVADSLQFNEEVSIEVSYRVLKEGTSLIPNIHVSSQEGILVFISGDTSEKARFESKGRGEYVSNVKLPARLLNEGGFTVDVAISTMDPLAVHVHERDVISFQIIEPTPDFLTRGDYVGPVPGLTRPHLLWETEHQS